MPHRDASHDLPAGARVATRFFPLSPPLRPYVSTIYLSEVAVPGGGRVEDYLHPEWANLRFVEGDPPRAAIGDSPVAETPRFIATGPTSTATYFAAGSGMNLAQPIGRMPIPQVRILPAAK